MADEKKIEDIFERLKRAQQEQERSAHKLAETISDLSQRGVKNLTEDLKNAAKQTGLFNEAQLSLIKSSDDLIEAVDEQEKKTEAIIAIQAKYKKSLADALNQEKKSFYQSKNGLKIAEEQYDADLNKLGLDRESAKHQIKSTSSFNEHSKGLQNNAENLKSFNKGIDSFGSKFKDANGQFSKSITSSYLLDKSKDLLSKGLVQGYDEFIKLTNVGLQGTLIQTNLSAMKLKMTFDQFSD